MQDFRNLRVWHSALELAVTTYVVTKRLPSSEIYGLTTQMRRAAISVSSNIAEACGRDSSAEFARFLQYAIGSVSELLSQAYVAQRLGFLEGSEAVDLIAQSNSTKKQLIRLRQGAPNAKRTTRTIRT